MITFCYIFQHELNRDFVYFIRLIGADTEPSLELQEAHVLTTLLLKCKATSEGVAVSLGDLDLQDFLLLRRCYITHLTNDIYLSYIVEQCSIYGAYKSDRMMVIADS